METILVTHTHRYGTNTYLFVSESFSKEKAEEFKPLVIDKFNIDYEEDRDDENLEFTHLEMSDIPNIELL